MKILLIHNFYGSSAPSGENQVFSAEREWLKVKGHQVFEYSRHSDEIRSRGLAGAFQGALCIPWNPHTLKRVRAIIQKEQPDVMHVHNTFPLISPAVFHAARGSRTAVVLTLHNYRTFCAAAIPMRNDRICTQCLDRQSIWPALRYGCYRNSRLATIPLAMMIALHRRCHTWKKQIDAFIALTGFQRDAMARAGLPADKIHVKPHFYVNPPDPVSWHRRHSKAVFVGRLARYKGVHVLIDAWQRWGEGAPNLDIIGDGPDRRLFEMQSAALIQKKKIRFLGQLSFAETQKTIGWTKLLILPSLCFEGFPMVIREAFALGVPVVASRIGSLPSLVADPKNGVLFEPGNAQDLRDTLLPLWNDQKKLSQMADAARRTFENRYTPEKNYPLLMDIYHQAINVRKTT